MEHLPCHSGTLSWPAQGLWAQQGQEEYFCVPVGGPWLQGRSGSMKKVLEGSLAACEKLLRSVGPLSCGALQMSLPVWDGAGAPWCHSEGSGGSLSLASSIKPKAEQISPSLLLAVYNPFSNFHYLQQRSNSGNQFSRKLSAGFGWPAACSQCEFSQFLSSSWWGTEEAVAACPACPSCSTWIQEQHGANRLCLGWP